MDVERSESDGLVCLGKGAGEEGMEGDWEGYDPEPRAAREQACSEGFLGS